MVEYQALHRDSRTLCIDWRQESQIAAGKYVVQESGGLGRATWWQHSQASAGRRAIQMCLNRIINDDASAEIATV